MVPRPTYTELEQRVIHLEEKIEQNSKEMSALLDGYRDLLSHHRFIDISRALYKIVSTLIGSTAGYVALLDETCSENEVLFLDSGSLSCTVDPDLPMPIRGLRAEAYSNTTPVYHNDFANSEWVAFMPDGHVILKNVLFAPLLLEGRAVGVMGLANKPENFSEKDAQLAFVFAELAAVALSKSKAKNIWHKKMDI